MTVISVSLTAELLQRLDKHVEMAGYSSRSEALRLAIRDSLTQFELRGRERGDVLATVTVISETMNSVSHVGLLDLRNGYDEIIFGNMHLHIDGGYCIEIFLLKGEAEKVMGFTYKAKAVRGVKEVNFTLTATEKS
jgi:CopG family nickel-responsive transcriptional regulator